MAEKDNSEDYKEFILKKKSKSFKGSYSDFLDEKYGRESKKKNQRSEPPKGFSLLSWCKKGGKTWKK